MNTSEFKDVLHGGYELFVSPWCCTLQQPAPRGLPGGEGGAQPLCLLESLGCIPVGYKNAPPSVSSNLFTQVAADLATEQGNFKAKDNILASSLL